jgi:hypothetical protein
VQSKEKVMRSAIEMAKEAGIDAWWDSGGDWRETFDEHLKAFEALVRADEREACAKVCESLFDLEDDSCDEAERCAEAIRARGHA